MFGNFWQKYIGHELNWQLPPSCLLTLQFVFYSCLGYSKTIAKYFPLEVLVTSLVDYHNRSSTAVTVKPDFPGGGRCPRGGDRCPTTFGPGPRHLHQSRGL